MRPRVQYDDLEAGGKDRHDRHAMILNNTAGWLM